MDITRTKQVVAELLKRTVENGCTESEAATAISKAQQLLAKFGLSVRDIESDKDEIVELKLSTDTKSLSSIQVEIALALKEHFGVEIIKTSIRSTGSSFIKVIGEQIKADIFIETFLFAYKAFKYNWSRYSKQLECSTSEKNLHRGTYLKGFVDGLTNELIRQESETALVVVKSEALSAHMKAMGSMSSASYRNRQSHNYDAYHRGYQSGSFAQRGKNKVITD